MMPMLEPVLAGLARAPLVERQSIEQMMASSREHSEQDIFASRRTRSEASFNRP